MKKHTRTPVYLRNLCCKKGVDEFISKLAVLKEAVTTRDHSPTNFYFNTNDSRNLSKRKFDLSFIEKQKEKAKKAKSKDTIPVIKYKGVEMQENLTVMNKLCKEAICGIKKRCPELKLEKIEGVKSTSFQQNFSQFQFCTQKSKERKELTSRNSLNNAMYSIRALSSSSKNKIYQKLKKNIPFGTRFHIIK